MGFSSKESEGKKFVIAGIPLRSQLKAISTKPKTEDSFQEDESACSTTPTARESKIPEVLACPPAPRKRRPVSTCHFNGVIEFFNPPDLESIFKCLAERAN